MSAIEGLHGSYIGPDTADGLRQGDRVRVLSDERSVVHVRWLTGAAKDTYGELHPRELVVDNPTTASRDEFGFEEGPCGGPTGINIEALYDKGGEVALLTAMEHTGALDVLKGAAREAVQMIRQAMAQDEVWSQVQESLGEDGPTVIANAIVAAVDSETTTDWSEDDDVEDFLGE
jgi:hypothetical protein